jgi:trans-aconitate methyltransferase
VTLADDYERQWKWRRFGDALAYVPIARGQRVLDVGCGIGAETAFLAERGADVIGVDIDDALLARARERHPQLRFEKHEAGALEPAAFGRFDGIWSSFVAAYFADLPAFVLRLRELLNDGGWIALIEIDDFLGHEPRTPGHAKDIAEFYAWARDNGGYGFNHGHQLARTVQNAGFTLLHEGTLDDDELSFRGAAPDDVLDAWRARFARMGGMQKFFGARMHEVNGAILEAMAATSHRSLCRVDFVVARR